MRPVELWSSKKKCRQPNFSMAPTVGRPYVASTAFVFLLLAVAASARPKCTEGVTLVAPAAAAPGRPTAVLVTVRGSAPVNVTLRLVSDRVEEATQLLASAHQTVRGQGIVSLSVPADASGACILQALVNCSGGTAGDGPALPAGAEDECSLQASTQLVVEGAVREVIVRPAMHLYRPGETVFFWVLALDHSLRGAQDVVGSVSVRDPSGVRVALWEEVALDMGVKEFSVELASVAALGAWRIEVRAEAASFEAAFNVTPASGAAPGTSAAISADDGVPEVAMAEEHFVELRFGPDMRRLYKPGLPFVGRVEAVSSEQCVRVRVKVYDNTTAIYSQDVEITSGEGMFVVPAILADSEVIVLQAELVSVEGKEIDSHYVLAREPVHKWRSASDCYLLVEGLEHTLQPEEVTHATVLSTCPCRRPLHYLVTTGGRATHWGTLPLGSAATKDTVRGTVDGAAVCRTNFSFTVEDIMAPVSHLLVYYVTEDGEPISDVVSFDVKLLLKDVSVSAEARKYWLPGQALPVNVTAEEGALVCLVGGGGPSTSDHAPTPPAPSVDQVRRRRGGAAAAAEADFLAAGVALFQRRCDRRRDARPPLSRSHAAAADATASSSSSRRSLLGAAALDRLWLWRCFNYTSSSSAAWHREVVAAPEEPGQWALWALTLSPSAGLRLSPPLTVVVFRPLSVFFSMPAALRVGETVEVDVRIGNNLNACMDVTVLLALTEGAHFLSNGLLYVTEKLRLGPHGATSLVVRVVVTSPGDKNLTVEVSGYASESCRDPTVASNNSSLVGSVLRSAVVSVRPEGLVRTATESAYFCANENMVISTSEDFRYEFVSAPRNRAELVFEVRAAAGARVALSDVRYTSERMYQLALGDLDNTVSWIGRGKHGYGVRLVSARTPQLLSEGAFRTFWVSWGSGAVALGRGAIPGKDTLLKWRLDRKLHVQHVGFASSWGHAAEFRVWNYNDEAGFSQVLHLDVPQPVLPGSEAGTLLIAGGLSLPTAAAPPLLHARSTSLDACVAAFSPLPLLQSGVVAQAEGSSSQEDILRRLQTQVQVLLAFRLPDGSFSDIRSQGSHMGTLQALRALARLQAYAGVDPELLASAKRWLQRRQAPDGRFPAAAVDGGVAAAGAGDALDQDVARTAETLATMLELGLESEADSESALRARYFLERHVFRSRAPTAVALQAHALAQARSEMAPAALDLLRNASANEEGDFGWSRTSATSDDVDATGSGALPSAVAGVSATGAAVSAPDWLYEEGVARRQKEPTLTSVGDFKASLFTLLTYVRLGDLKSAEPVARYLFYRAHLLDQHVELLYPAVQAFSEFASLALDRHRALTVSLATSGMELTDTLELRPGAAPQHLQLPSLPTKVFVYATGAGCATVQGRVSYSTYAPAEHTHLLDLWAGVEGELVPSRNSLDELEGKLPRLRLRTCIQWKGEEPASVLRLEVTLFSGFQLESVEPTGVEVHHGSLGDLVWFVLSNVSNSCPYCIRFLVRSPFVVSGLRPAFARVYPAGREDLAAEAFFHTRQGSLLLADITDDDLITWFGKDERGQPRMESDFSKVCECGRVCEPSSVSSTTVSWTDKNYNHGEKDLNKANVLILSEANATGNMTQFTLTSAEVTLQSNTETNISDDSFSTLALVNNVTNSESVLVIGNIKPEATESASFDIIIPAEEAEALRAAPDQLVIITSNMSNFNPDKASSNITTTDKIHFQENITKRPNIAQTNAVTSATTASVSVVTRTKNENTPLPEGRTTSTEPLSSSQTRSHQQQPRSINKERYSGLASTPPTLEPDSTTSVSSSHDEKLFVLDRDALWGMLREVVHVELNKRNKKEDSSVDAVLH